MITCCYIECCYIKQSYRAYYIKSIYIILHIPSHIVENWDASSYIPLLFSLAHMIQGHIGTLTLKKGFAVLELH